MSNIIKVLNLYSGIGGNRKLWNKVEVDAVEKNKEIAKIYSDNFPNDNMIIGDALKYLEHNYQNYDFIWSSPPCQSHSKIRKMACDVGKYKPKIPDMSLYGQILFLKYYFDGKWVVENVNGFYDPLIKPKIIQRHYFWSNFVISNINLKSGNIDHIPNNEMAKYYGVDNLDDYNLKTFRKDQALRNCVHPILGKHILDCAFKIKQKIIGE